MTTNFQVHVQHDPRFSHVLQGSMVEQTPGGIVLRAAFTSDGFQSGKRLVTMEVHDEKILLERTSHRISYRSAHVEFFFDLKRNGQSDTVARLHEMHQRKQMFIEHMGMLYPVVVEQQFGRPGWSILVCEPQGGRRNDCVSFAILAKLTMRGDVPALMYEGFISRDVHPVLRVIIGALPFCLELIE